MGPHLTSFLDPEAAGSRHTVRTRLGGQAIRSEGTVRGRLYHFPLSRGRRSSHQAISREIPSRKRGKTNGPGGIRTPDRGIMSPQNTPVLGRRQHPNRVQDAPGWLFSVWECVALAGGLRNSCERGIPERATAKEPGSGRELATAAAPTFSHLANPLCHVVTCGDKRACVRFERSARITESCRMRSFNHEHAHDSERHVAMLCYNRDGWRR